MPKTSASQFEMLVDYMERNGDLSKPTTGPSGRLHTISRWDDLTRLLNADGTGDSKTTDKWRKVWSDLKNNTKRKKSKIVQSASGTGGGPATKIRLTDLEDRVINIIGPQAATGIPEVPEIGFTQEIIPPGPSQCLPLSSPAAPETSETYVEDLHHSPVVGSPHEPGSLHEPAGSPQPSTSRRLITPRVRLTPRHSQQNATSPQRRARLQTESGRERGRLTPRRRRRLDPQEDTSPLPRRRARPQTQSERARQEFVESDREWRAFYLNREQEATRLREMELAQQARWQDLFAQFLQTCNAAIDVFKNRNI